MEMDFDFGDMMSVTSERLNDLDRVILFADSVAVAGLPPEIL